MNSVSPSNGNMQPDRSRLLVDRRMNGWRVKVVQRLRESRRVRTKRASWPEGALGEIFAFAIQNLDQGWIEISLYRGADIDHVSGATKAAAMIADGRAEMLPWSTRTLSDGTRARGVAIGRVVDEAGAFDAIARGLGDEVFGNLARDGQEVAT